jgi:hypothetical protein
VANKAHVAAKPCSLKRARSSVRGSGWPRTQGNSAADSGAAFACPIPAPGGITGSADVSDRQIRAAHDFRARPHPRSAPPPALPGRHCVP